MTISAFALELQIGEQGNQIKPSQGMLTLRTHRPAPPPTQPAWQTIYHRACHAPRNCPYHKPHPHYYGQAVAAVAAAHILPARESHFQNCVAVYF